jgi:hypothetical protein
MSQQIIEEQSLASQMPLQSQPDQYSHSQSVDAAEDHEMSQQPDQ